MTQNESNDSQSLVNRLLETVKECQIHYGRRTELATDFDKRVVNLCNTLEEALSDGLKKHRNLINITKSAVSRRLPKNVSANLTSPHQNDNNTCFWHFVRLHLNRHEYERYLLLKNVKTDMGRGRSWLRSALNEHSLEKYILMMLDNDTIRCQYYDDCAFIRDEEMNSVLPNIARGLSTILFAINIDNHELDVRYDSVPIAIPNGSSDPLPVLAASSASSFDSVFAKRRNRRVPKVNVISLADDDNGENDDSDDDAMHYARSAPSKRRSSVGQNDITAAHLGIGIGIINTDREWPYLKPIKPHDQTKNFEMVDPNIGTDMVLKPILNDSSDTSNVEDDNSDKLSNDQFDMSKAKESRIEGESETKEMENNNHNEEMMSLRVELQNFKKKYDEKVLKYESQIDLIVKENDVLKMQLKKYIAAVQLLRPDDNNKGFDLSSSPSENEKRKSEHSPSSYLYYNEVNEYEKKLVQVAEMHGELVEFNDHLHRVILQKEAIINRLKEELIDLRGPLPEVNQTSDDEMSITSDATPSMPSSMVSRSLVHIWVPTAFLAGGPKNKSHHVYQIYVRVKDEEWNVYRRYSQFHELHRGLRKKYPETDTFGFPPKKTIGNKDSKVVQERRKKLEYYIRCLINLLQTKHNVVDKEHLIVILPFLNDRLVQSTDPRTNSRSIPDLHQHYMGL